MSGTALDAQRAKLGATPAAVDEARWLLRRRLQRLSCNSNLLPSLLNVAGVSPTGKVVGSGRFADVYRGTYQGRDVAVKHLRIFKMIRPSDEPKVKEVSSEISRDALL